MEIQSLLDSILSEDDYDYFLNERKTLISKAEFKVAMLVAADLSNKEIANRLHLSVHTVRRHISNIIVKSECVQSRTGVGIMYVKDKFYLE